MIDYNFLANEWYFFNNLMAVYLKNKHGGASKKYRKLNDALNKLESRGNVQVLSRYMTDMLKETKQLSNKLTVDERIEMRINEVRYVSFINKLTFAIDQL